jgi:hypothetical protein
MSGSAFAANQVVRGNHRPIEESTMAEPLQKRGSVIQMVFLGR